MKRFSLWFFGFMCLLPGLNAQAVQQLIKSGATEPIPVFVTDATGAPVTGIASNAFTLTVRKPGTASYVAAAGSIAESGNGVYDYTPTSVETTIAASKNILLVHAVVTATATSFGDSSAQIVAFDPQDSAALGLSRLDVAVSSRNAVAPANPTDYARNNVSPTWYAAGGDPFGIVKTGGAYAAGTWGAFFNAQLLYAVPNDYALRGTAPSWYTAPPAGVSNFYAPVQDLGGGSSSVSLAVTVTRNTSNQPVVTWTPDSLATSYKVLRSTNGITYTALFQTTLTTYTDTARPTGNVYYSIISVH